MNFNHYFAPRDPFFTHSSLDPQVRNMLAKQDSEVMAASALASLVRTQDAFALPPSLMNYHGLPLVHHRYDVRDMTPAKAEAPKTPQISIPERYTRNGRKRAIPFPLKLMMVLSDESHSHIISWMPDGKSFIIIRPKAFVAEILPQNFKSAQYASFTRKLSRWGFTRCDDGTGEFSHPLFQKGNIELAEKMRPAGSNSKGEDQQDQNEETSPRNSPVVATENKESEGAEVKVEAEAVSTNLSRSPRKSQPASPELNVIHKPNAMRIQPPSVPEVVSSSPSSTSHNPKVMGGTEIEMEALRLRNNIREMSMRRKFLMSNLESSAGTFSSYPNSSRAFLAANTGGVGMLNKSNLLGSMQGRPYPNVASSAMMYQRPSAASMRVRQLMHSDEAARIAQLQHDIKQAYLR